MIATIIWLIGLILAIKAAIEIFSLKGNMIIKLLFIILILITSWVGLIFYYLIGRSRIPKWVA